MAGRKIQARVSGAGVPRGDLKTTQVLAGHPRPRRLSHPLTLRRGLAVLACVVVVLASDGARAGHEIPFYPSFYPQEITLTVVAPAAAPRLLGKNALHAYVGPLDSATPAHTAWIESLRSVVLLTFNPRSPAWADSGQRCAAAARLLPALGPSRGDYTFQPYPVTPYHEDFLHHGDLVEAAKTKAREAPRGVVALRVRATGRLAELLRGSGSPPAAGGGDADLVEGGLPVLAAEEVTRLGGLPPDRQAERLSLEWVAPRRRPVPAGGGLESDRGLRGRRRTPRLGGARRRGPPPGAVRRRLGSQPGARAAAFRERGKRRGGAARRARP